MPQQKFNSARTDVMQRLPQEVRDALTNFWASVDVPPFVLTTAGLIAGSGLANGERSGILKLNPAVTAFDLDFVAESPIEVVQSLIAASLADCYLHITDPTQFPQNQSAPVEDVSRLMAEWGFSYNDPEIYQVIKSSPTVDKLAAFYAFRYGHFNRLPSPTEDLDAIVASLKEMNGGHLELDLRSEMRGVVRVYDFGTKKVSEIPRSEIAPSYVLARIEGVEGTVYVDIREIQSSSQPVHGGLSGEFERAIRYCMKLEGDADPTTFEGHVDLFLRDLNPKRDLMNYFRCALVFAHFASTKVISRTQRQQMWLWIAHCSQSESTTVMETWEWESEDRSLFQQIANFYYACDYEAEFKKLFDPAMIFPLPLASTEGEIGGNATTKPAVLHAGLFGIGKTRIHFFGSGSNSN
jgi:hypothetical protein